MRDEIKNALWIILGKVSLILGTLIFFSVLSKKIPQYDYGQFTILILTVSLVTVISQFGINHCFAKFYNQKNRFDGISVIRRCLLIQLLISSTICGFISFFVDYEFYSLLMIFSVMFRPFDIYKSAFDAELSSKTYQRYEIACSFLFSCLKIYFAYNGSVDYVCIVFFLERLTVCLLLVCISKKLKPTRTDDSDISYKYIILESFPMLIPSLIYILYSRMDQAVIYNLLSPVEQAKYFASTQVAEGFSFIANSIAISYFSSMTKSKDESEYRRYLELASQTISRITIPIAIFVTIFGEYILVTLFTPEYASSATVLSILAWCVVILGHSAISVKHLIYIGKQRYSIYRALTGLAINLPLTLYMTKQFGISGAAFSTIISQFTALFLSNLFFKETRFLFNIQIRSLILLR
ncbi:putative Polysaccharide biosynthesis protein C-terminal domain-containing protein [Vibrio crassostreae]|uniref:oligosaccharide flippase family protein n=1 Tax=Vibrio crassostreae TaxID=246167 RepID=UPI00104C0C80|nr:polysaccharide biosynthesis C-terminal domain-containing protein [Vibrio crassostreae]TCN85195.1 O-antigen/teichoic acid export membrane protein [Vibrio crassostreae]CAK3029518.1 putative Polysaccharide biosynthesis protein C-terminal domain-containing protein [Vibrio crassostreae]